MGPFCYVCGSRDGHLARSCNNRDNKFCPPCKSRDHCFLECPSRERCAICNKPGHDQSICFQNQNRGQGGNSTQYNNKRVRFLMLKSKNISFTEMFEDFNNSKSDEDSSEDELLIKDQIYGHKVKSRQVSTKAIQTTLSRPNNLVRHTSVLYREDGNIFSVSCKIENINLQCRYRFRHKCYFSK